jgi:hypothetical protein
MATNSRSTDQGSGFTDYNKFLGANQQSGEDSGQAIASGLNNQKQSVLGDLSNQQDTFNQGLQTQKDAWGNIVGQAKSIVDPATQGNYDAVAQQAQTLDPSQVGSQFKNYNYTGPGGLANADSLQTNSATASALGRLAGNSQGQQQLLRNYVGGSNNYTQGQSAFDQALLNKYGQAPISQAAQGLQGISTNVNNAINTSQNAANQQKNLVSGQKQDIWNNATTGLNTVQQLATNQGTDFNNEANDVQTLSGYMRDLLSTDPATKAAAYYNIQNFKDAKGNSIDANKLIQDAQTNMGLSLGNKLYLKEGSNFNQSNLGGILGDVIANNQSIGGKYYQGKQQDAASALAKFLQQDSNAIDNNNFNTNVFGGVQSNVKNFQDNLNMQANADIDVKKAADMINSATNSLITDPNNYHPYNINQIYSSYLPTIQNSGINKYDPTNSNLTTEQKQLYSEYFNPNTANMINQEHNSMLGWNGTAPTGLIGHLYEYNQNTNNLGYNPGALNSDISKNYLNNAIIQNQSLGNSAFTPQATTLGSNYNFNDLYNYLINNSGNRNSNAGGIYRPSNS